MFIAIPKPSETSAVFIDTSAIMNYLLGDLGLPGFSDGLDRSVREFINQFLSRRIRIRITPTLKNEIRLRRDIARRNAMKYGLRPFLYDVIESKVEKRYEKLQSHIQEEAPSLGRLPDVQDFYQKNQSHPELVACRAKKPDEGCTPVPGSTDMKILAEVINYSQCYFITSDCDYHSLDEEIQAAFGIHVLSQENMLALAQKWDWNLT